MSKKRQSAARAKKPDDRLEGAIFVRASDSRAAITTLSNDYPTGNVIPLHYHDRDQLVFAARGIMTVHTASGTWAVPTHWAVWIPARVPHTIRMSGSVAMRTLYVKLGVVRAMPRACCVVNVSPLLKELLLAACAHSRLQQTVERQRHLIDVILDQLEVLPRVAQQLPYPADARAKRVAEALLTQPGAHASLATLCRNSGASKRTMERLFVKDMGMTLGKWRQQARLFEAMRLLAAGEKVTHAALEAGYSTPSAFIAMFRRTLGTTPRAYFQSELQSR
jgi:AraC-like DNA-binding protein/mannose-6-phosphate isomerase-like protein (cupin superfamily)